MIIVDHVAQSIRPTTAAGDVWFGLASGTNGTAATVRRALADVPPGYRWELHDGRRAAGLDLVPSGGAWWRNPWGASPRVRA